MANQHDKRFWYVVASWSGGEGECTSALLTYTQARKLVDAVEAVGMIARIESWAAIGIKRSAA